MTRAELLAIPMGENDAGAKTIGDYLRILLITLWTEEEGFSGKRPFGNSGWKREPVKALIQAGVSTGRLDEDGYIADEGDAETILDKLVRNITLT